MNGLGGTSLRKAVQFAITTEQVGARSYRRLAHRMGASDALDAIIRAERDHLLRVAEKLWRND